MKTEDIAKVADSNPVQALTGKVSGVQINTQTGQPGVVKFQNPYSRYQFNQCW